MTELEKEILFSDFRDGEWYKNYIKKYNENANKIFKVKIK